MPILTYALQGIALGLSAAASPGPFQAYLLAQSVRLGWRRALPAAFAPLVSDGPIIFLVLLVLTRLPAGFLTGLRIVGSLFVLYLAWQSLQAYRRFQPDQVGAGGGSEKQSVFQAALMNFLNPNPYIFWSILGGPVLLSGWNSHPSYGIGFMLGMYITFVAALALLIFLFGSAGRLGPRVNRFLLGFSSLALLVFGLYQLYQGLLIGLFER